MLEKAEKQDLVDTHCHILPNVDDGAANLNEALLMAQLAVANGTHTIVATPHHGIRNFINSFEAVCQKVARLNSEIRLRNLPLTILPGQEVRIHPRFIDELYNGVIQPLNGTRYILLELPSNGVPDYFDELLHELSILQLIPILAHPERNYEFQKYPSRLLPYLKRGVLLQVTSQSIMGLFGKTAQRLAFNLCKANRAHLLASDAHNMSNRPGMLKQSYDLLEDKIGLQRVQVFKRNAVKVVNNEDIDQTFNGSRKRKTGYLMNFGKSIFSNYLKN
ncbi:tyrosine-protein phosphatase [Paenibacillus sp. SI8]|uniref:tyrosine-protein phosphatase n=1 Tax=unclassified Paenibacillus TaxID=185978 RepID=UPI0034650323